MFQGGDRIEPEPVMKCSYAQAATDQVGKRKRPPVSCKLYDARSKRIKKMGWKPEIVLNLCSELAQSLKPPSFLYVLNDQEASSVFFFCFFFLSPHTYIIYNYIYIH